MTNVFSRDLSAAEKFAREVVAKRVAIILVITIVLNLAISYHWITPDISADVTRHVKDALDALATIVGTFVVRAAVTPSSDPRSPRRGEKLVPLSSVVEQNAPSVEKAPSAEYLAGTGEES